MQRRRFFLLAQMASGTSPSVQETVSIDQSLLSRLDKLAEENSLSAISLGFPSSISI